jgi:hypothetical protein
LEYCRDEVVGFKVDVIRRESKRGKGGKMTENRVEAIAELIMEGKFGVVDAVEEVVARGIKKGAAKAFGRGRREDGYTEFAVKKKGVVGVGEAVGCMVSRETV